MFNLAIYYRKLISHLLKLLDLLVYSVILVYFILANVLGKADELINKNL